MKKYIILAIALVCSAAVMAQDDYDDTWCKGLKNPTSFVLGSTNNSAHAQWSGMIGTKAGSASTCDNWAGTGLTAVTAANLATQASGSSCTPGNEAATHQNRFLIVYPGTDDLWNLEFVIRDGNLTFFNTFLLQQKGGSCVI